ncbi:MAG TPA: hypothetical protein VL978_04315 [Puia sp.]|nr:hypothetical protein [Puia sp.]
MKRLTAITISLCMLAAFTCNGQDSIPYLTGKVKISLAQGTFDCEFTMKDYPIIPDYLIRINSGMNIFWFKNEKGYRLLYDKSTADSTGTFESCDYSFPTDYRDVDKFLPPELQFRYTGKYPVVRDTTESGDVEANDWRGNIAFNGYSVRADGLQSAWYPELYDIKKKKQYERVRYDMDIDCADCRVIYVNGVAPIKGTHAHVHSEVPRELFLFAGNFPVVSSEGTYFLDAGLSAAQLHAFAKMTADAKHFYEAGFKVPFMDPITYVQANPTAPRYGFSFVSFPTIVNVGFGEYALSGFHDPANSPLYEVMSHELAHYYFGTIRQFNTFFGAVLQEGLAEFLALNVLKNEQADTIYEKTLLGKIKDAQTFQQIPMSRLNSEKDFWNRELYVYYFAPVIFLAIQKEIGDSATWEWMHQLLTMPTQWTDYAFLETTLQKALGDKAKSTALAAKYFETPDALQNAIKELAGGPVHP